MPAAASDMGGGGIGQVIPPAADFHANFREAIADHGLGYAAAGRDLEERFAGLVAPTRVVSVERKSWSGHVYNLATAQGWYIADNIVTHNCEIAFAPVVEDVA